MGAFRLPGISIFFRAPNEDGYTPSDYEIWQQIKAGGATAWTRDLDGRIHAPISSMEATPILSMETAMISLWFNRDAVVAALNFLSVIRNL